ncbi:hypothetical protein DQ04_00141020 [Trypanosoma grayi]|uniref:hypothetical protein n=1 Tax=Trypanosoma grayi TaxID=71804 RepID=UPI0004F42D37|nr:hypothetical protein DQ04_00141020 [Trypanosoma grayi]KEG15214.1 hypothetical protein DQ04_00141020 [Trypanosoma grayi]
MEIRDRTAGEETVDANQTLFLHVHFFLCPILRGARGIPGVVHGSAMVQNLAQTVSNEFPTGTTFEIRRDVRINRHFHQRDYMWHKRAHTKQDVSKRRITICEEYRLVPPEFASTLSPCDRLPFHMAFLFDPTLQAVVTHYTNMRYAPERESGAGQTTRFVAVFRGVEVYSIRELVENFFRAYLEKPEEELEAGHPFPLLVPSTVFREHKTGDADGAEDNNSTTSTSSSCSGSSRNNTKNNETAERRRPQLPDGFVSARAFLEAKEHHRLVSDPVQQVLLCDRELGVMVLGRALDKRIIGPPARPPLGPQNSMTIKSSPAALINTNGDAHRISVILHMSSPLLPPFRLRHFTGAMVEAVGLFTRPSSPFPEFRVRCSVPDDDDDVALSYRVQKRKKKRVEEIESLEARSVVMTLEDAHRALSGAPKEKPKTKKRSPEGTPSNEGNLLALPNATRDAVDAFRLHDEMGPTLGWLLRSSTAFLFA